MKTLIFVVVIAFIGIGLTLLAMENPGYVLLARPPWSVEMPLTLFGVFALLATLAAYLAIHLLVRVWRIPRDVARWRQLRHTRRVEESLTQGLMYLMEGSWIKAEKRLVSDLRHNPHPLINYLAAAAAAQAADDIEQRNQYLRLAEPYGERHRIAFTMVRAHLHYVAREFEPALALLTELRTLAPNHPHVLRLLARVYQDLRDWANLVLLLPELRKKKILPLATLDALELETQRELLSLPLPRGAQTVLHKAWQSVPPALRHQPVLVEIYVRQLLQQGETNAALAILNETLKRRWDERLAYWYGRVRGDDVATQLATAESWLEQHRDSADLLLTLGRLALDAKQRTKAKEYLERCVALRESPEAYAELADLLQQGGDKELAQEWLQRAIKLQLGDVRTANTKRTSTVYEFKR